MRSYVIALAILFLVTAAGSAGAQGFDAKRHMPLAEVEPGMTGIGKTTLEGSSIVEFQFKVLAILKNAGPKRDLIVVRASGANLEETGIIAGMSGSPLFINGRLIGAVAYAFQWGKAPICGVQPIEQMLRVSDEKPWTRTVKPAAAQAGTTSEITNVESRLAALGAPLTGGDAAATQAFAVPVAAIGIGDVPPALLGRDTVDLRPVQTPVMVSGMTPRGLERLRQCMAPVGLVPMQGGGVDLKRLPAARMEPGAPLAIPLVRGDINVTSMGTITEILGDRLYAFGHAMFGQGEADLPLMSGVAQVVIPSLLNSFRMGAPVEEIGRLVWDEQTAIFGRLTKERAPMVPVTVKITGPGAGVERTFHMEVARHRRLLPMLASMVVGDSLTAHSELPRDHTILYRLAIKPVGHDAIVRENMAVGPDADMYLEGQIRGVVGLMVENPFQNLDLESVEAQIQIEPSSRLAEILEVRPLRNAVRPGQKVPVDIRIRPFRAEPRWIQVEVPIPADYPEGSFRLTLCGADEAVRAEMREVPARFRPEDVDSMLSVLRRNERRDQLFMRLEAPGAGVSIGREELPDLPPTMKTILSDSARQQVSGVALPRVSKQVMPYELHGSGDITVTVDRHAPQP